MTTTADLPAVREIPTGHVVRLPDGREVEFGTVWNGWDADELRSVVVWTHDLPDAEVLLRARAYLEGPVQQQCDDPYELAGGHHLWAREFWPDVEGDMSRHVKRVWARWHVVTEAEACTEFSPEAGSRLWVESPEPGEGLRPVTAVELEAE